MHINKALRLVGVSAFVIGSRGFGSPPGCQVSGNFNIEIFTVVCDLKCNVVVGSGKINDQNK
jgi:hypothetical protein